MWVATCMNPPPPLLWNKSPRDLVHGEGRSLRGTCAGCTGTQPSPSPSDHSYTHTTPPQHRHNTAPCPRGGRSKCTRCTKYTALAGKTVNRVSHREGSGPRAHPPLAIRCSTVITQSRLLNVLNAAAPSVSRPPKVTARIPSCDEATAASPVLPCGASSSLSQLTRDHSFDPSSQ